jgi:transcriptional regulator with GAF, ATPase, and Fis domain
VVNVAFSVVLTAVARLVADAVSLNDAVSRLVEVLRDAIPFERMHLLRLDRADTIVLYTALASGELEVVGHRIPSGAVTEVGGGDRVLAADAKSVMICPMRQGSRILGALWFTSTRANAFDDEHHSLMEDVADLVMLAVHHDSLRTTEAVRRERLESLDRLLQTMAETLDIRHIFDQVSEVVRAGLPHEILALTSWAGDGRTFRVYAMSGATVDEPGFWEPITLPDSERALLSRESYVINNATTEVEPATVRGRIFRQLGVQSALRVPMPLGSDVFGSLFFLSRTTDSFADEDVDFARRVADHLALALSYQHLADAARRDAEARETAARLEAQVATLTRELEAHGGSHHRVIGVSKSWKDVLAQAARVAQTETTVLLTGESGTGKEVVARFIHHGSPRSRGGFVAINCAALPDTLLESELFGHERGAFTGAVAAKPGRIELANGGVLFLDEVGEMSPAVQARLLRVLEEREFLRLGGTRSMRADIRVIAATNRDLLAALQRGDFREDLYYRLGVFEIALPPLRERPEDIFELADGFLKEIGELIGRPVLGIARDAKDQLLAYAWPGNVRELRNAIERAVILADGGYIRSEHLPVTAPRPAAVAELGGAAALPAGGVNLEAIERSLVIKALTQARHNKTRAAKLLGLTRAQLYSRIEKYGLAESES